MQLLVDAGAALDVVDGKSGRTALFHAAEANLFNIASLLLQKGASVNTTNYSGNTAVQVGFTVVIYMNVVLYGKVCGFKIIAIACLQKGATVNATHYTGNAAVQVGVFLCLYMWFCMGKFLVIQPSPFLACKKG